MSITKKDFKELVTKKEFRDYQAKAFATFAAKEDLKNFYTKREMDGKFDRVITLEDEIVKLLKDMREERSGCFVTIL